MLHPGTVSPDSRPSSMKSVAGTYSRRSDKETNRNIETRSWRLRQRTRARIGHCSSGANRMLCNRRRCGETPSTGGGLGEATRWGAAASEDRCTIQRYYSQPKKREINLFFCWSKVFSDQKYYELNYWPGWTDIFNLWPRDHRNQITQ